MRASSRTVLASSPPWSVALEPVRCSRCLPLRRSLHCTVSFSRPPRVSPPRHARLFHFGPAPSSASLGRTGGARSLWAWTPGQARDRRETSSRASAGNPLTPPFAHRPLALAPSLAGSSRSLARRPSRAATRARRCLCSCAWPGPRDEGDRAVHGAPSVAGAWGSNVQRIGIRSSCVRALDWLLRASRVGRTGAFGDSAGKELGRRSLLSLAAVASTGSCH